MKRKVSKVLPLIVLGLSLPARAAQDSLEKAKALAKTNLPGAEAESRGFIETMRRVTKGQDACPAPKPGGKAAASGAFRRRGVMEGFYGRPWTWEQRRDMVRWMGTQGFNLFVIAPKDDALLRAEWRRPLPEDYLKEFKSLAAEGRKAGVELAWALSPGLDLKPGEPAEVRLAAEKFMTVQRAGVKHLVLAFDDTDPVEAQIDFANEVRAALGNPDDLTFIPAVYWGDAAPSPYYDALAGKLHPSFRVGYTGGQIISRSIGAEEARRFKEYIKHPIVLGDNYPVQDRVHSSGRVFLGPLEGRDPGLARVTEAFLANASPLPEASKLPLATVAAYARNPAGYDPEKAFRCAAASLAKPEARESFLLFAEMNRSSWITLRESTWPADGARQRMTALERLPEKLKRGLSPPLEQELRPWIEKSALLARAMNGDAEAAKKAADSPAVVADFALERALRADPCGGLRGKISAHVRGEAVPELGPCLDALGRSRGGLLVPAADALALAARRARKSLDGKPPRAAFDGLYKWRVRARFMPLMAMRALMEQSIEKGRRFPRLYKALARWERPRIPEEAKPWQWKVRDYGRAGLGELDPELLKSANGLELALELKQALDAFTRWSRLPQDQRPRTLDLAIPADPAELL